MTNIFLVSLFLIFSFFVIRATNKITNSNTVNKDNNLDTLRNYVADKNVSCKKTSLAVTSLLASSYFLVHILTNKGENYNDSMQAQSYKKSLTSENLEVINSIEGNYEQYCL